VQTPTSQAQPSSADRKDTLEKEKRFVGIYSATLLILKISFSRQTRKLVNQDER